MLNRCCSVAVVSIIAIAGSVAIAQPGKDTKPAAGHSAPAQPGKKAEMPAMPAGFSEADMKACMEAGIPGPMHEHLKSGVGMWKGEMMHWMAPGTEPMKTEMTTTITSLMDGRFVQIETKGEMPGMGMFHGMGINGYDNVAQKFQSTWIDNMGSTMMVGTGELSSDKKTLTWEYTYTCPITKKAAKMREVETFTGKDTMKLEMFGADPKSGKEFKMMEGNFTRTGGAMPAKSASGEQMKDHR